MRYTATRVMAGPSPGVSETIVTEDRPGVDKLVWNGRAERQLPTRS